MSVAPAVGRLPPKKLRELRAKAHALKPVVWLSQHGMSEGALREVERALSAHELIKIHAPTDDRQARVALLESICRDLDAEPVQIIGKTLVAYRARPEPSTPQAKKENAPRPRARPASRRNRPAGTGSAKRVRRSKPRN